ncbi:uncharacterized protein BJ212DRAFT_839720 [Suillus subaureus]|uniref:HNH nuclease domain-containing protein n=1 Tax=Suillus subaureus TaxID=48587 RepID=A0A9P7EIT5_9AGAM|nr:uncharacterized protein BJ212DRAFT_839720 [Suillus subaureus]KAG1822946.1 hypothetical protein BJ212DRAFT_839720 [Suillus subaureus]
MWDKEQMPADSNQVLTTLHATHILKRVISAGYMLQLATWDIIRRYSRISATTIRNMERLVDDSSNGMTLYYSVHTAFDNLTVYFEQAEENL